MNREPLQFGLRSLFLLTASVAAIAALPYRLAFCVLIATGYVAFASGWAIDAAIAVGRRVVENR